MSVILVRYGIPLLILGLMVFSIVDILTIAGERVRHLPKIAWVLLVVFLSFVGSLLWFLVGREPDPASPRARRPGRGPVAPDDDPEFLARLRREREQEERIRKLEQRLSELDDDQPD